MFISANRMQGEVFSNWCAGRWEGKHPVFWRILIEGGLLSPHQARHIVPAQENIFWTGLNVYRWTSKAAPLDFCQGMCLCPICGGGCLWGVSWGLYIHSLSDTASVVISISGNAHLSAEVIWNQWEHCCCLRWCFSLTSSPFGTWVLASALTFFLSLQGVLGSMGSSQRLFFIFS